MKQGDLVKLPDYSKGLEKRYRSTWIDWQEEMEEHCGGFGVIEGPTIRNTAVNVAMVFPKLRGMWLWYKRDLKTKKRL